MSTHRSLKKGITPQRQEGFLPWGPGPQGKRCCCFLINLVSDISSQPSVYLATWPMKGGRPRPQGGEASRLEDDRNLDVKPHPQQIPGPSCAGGKF